MNKTREESLEEHMEHCQGWYGERCYVTEEYGYMIIHDTLLYVDNVAMLRSDGWLFCGKVEDSYLFTWEGL